MYLELIGGRQSRLDFDIVTENINFAEDQFFNLNDYNKKKNLKSKKNLEVNEEDYKLHLDKVLSIKNSIWKRIKN